MAEQDKNQEATWQYPEREGRGGQQNPPGDQGQDRQNPDGTPVERSGMGREERKGGGYGHIAERGQAGQTEGRIEGPEDTSDQPEQEGSAGGGRYGPPTSAGHHKDTGYEGPSTGGSWEDAPGGFA